MNLIVRQTISLFVALRVADLINLFAGLYFVPKFVSPAELGAVLPVTTFATTVSIPAFAFALVFLREGAILARRGSWGEYKSLVKGVFVAVGALLAFGALVAAVALPPYLRRVGVHDTAAGVLVLAGAFLGAVAPVYSDALNAVRRFRALGAVEIVSALARLAALAILMPFRALAGYFAGTVVQPLARIASSIFLLRSELSVPAKPYWTRPLVRRLVLLALAVTAYLAAPLLASLAEQSVIRISLGTDDSAAYFMLTRLSGLLDYLTLPLLLVLFPHAAQEKSDSTSTAKLILGCEAAVLIAGIILAGIFAFWGANLIRLLPNGSAYADRSAYLLPLVAIGTLNSLQVLCANAAVAGGRLKFLFWYVPLNLAYAALLAYLPTLVTGMSSFLMLAGAFALLRALLAQTTLDNRRQPTAEPRS